ncbi:helix-turn-helix domain-containing protein [Gynuella sp.]|uniref:AraC family transcriptional regulator n=1 Tax=Gynuella sp. TaxID=2969146 RepID=UPI003D09C11B
MTFSKEQNVLVLLDVKHPYDRMLIDGMVEALQNSNDHLQMSFMAYDEALLVAQDDHWDAIVADFDRPGNVELCRRFQVPVVGLMSYHHVLPEIQLPGLIYVAPDTQSIVVKAMEHMVACGVRQFGYFSGMAAEIGLWAEQRENLFRQCVEESGYQWLGGFDTFTIRQHLTEGAFGHRGYLCASDTQARQLITLAGKLQLNVPGDLAIIGIDNDAVENQLSRVPICTVPLDPRQLGVAAYNALRELKDAQSYRHHLVSSGDVVNRLSAYLSVSDDALVSKAMKYIYCHYHRPIKAEQIIVECNTSRSTLESRFKKHLHKTIHQVLHEVRLEHAKELLSHTDTSIEDIALQCGLSSVQYLYYLFRKEVGITPNQYRIEFSHELNGSPITSRI